MDHDVLREAEIAAAEEWERVEYGERMKALWQHVANQLPDGEPLRVYASGGTYIAGNTFNGVRQLVDVLPLIDSFPHQMPPPKVLTWWRRMAIRLLGGQP